MRSRPEAILERHALRLASREVPEVVLHRNEVGHGHPRVVGRLIQQALTGAGMHEAARIVEQILVRNRITWGLGKGSPDLVIVRGGIELKVPGERLRSSQLECREAWRSRGLHYEVATTPEEVVEAARLIGSAQMEANAHTGRLGVACDLLRENGFDAEAKWLEDTLGPKGRGA